MRIDHFGIVVKDIREHVRTHWPHLFSMDNFGPVIHDPLQKVRVSFLDLPGGRLELVEPAAEDSPVAAVLRQAGASYNHICFEVPNLDAELQTCRENGMVVVSPPQPAVAFDGRRIAFLLSRDGLLWELLEADTNV
jgi:methylmalonyl-CoA/ethylmalonyl-CoA epimerase